MDRGTASLTHRHQARGNRVGIVLGFQDTTPYEGDLSRIAVFHDLGVRVVQLTYNVRNLVGDGCLEPGNAGLSAFGHQVIDQSAGDIDDVGQPLSEAFISWIDEARDALAKEDPAGFRRTSGDAYGFPGNYRQQFPVVTATLARS